MSLRPVLVVALAIVSACSSGDSKPGDGGTDQPATDAGDAVGTDTTVDKPADAVADLAGDAATGTDAVADTATGTDAPSADVTAADTATGTDAAAADLAADAATGTDSATGTDAATADAGDSCPANYTYVPDSDGGACLPPVYMFSGGGKAGAMGGRAGADGLCSAAVTSYSFPYTGTAAFISVSADDEIRDMPALYSVPIDRPIVGPTGIRIADSWADLLDGTIQVRLGLAGLDLPNGAYGYYTGSTTAGAVTSKTCTSWTAAYTMFDGTYGTDYAADKGWISMAEATCGSANYHVLCLGYEP